MSEMLIILLERTGYTTDVVSDGQSCIEWVETGIYDALIVDAVLPKMDGFAVLDVLRAKNNDIPILMLTTNNTLADRIRGLNNGVDYCLGKPFDDAELLACLASIIHRTFLMEAGFIGLVGGSIGLLLSYGVSTIINIAAKSSAYQGISFIPFWLALLAIVFSVVMGMLAGFLPAFRAMHLSPLAALRNE